MNQSLFSYKKIYLLIVFFLIVSQVMSIDFIRRKSDQLVTGPKDSAVYLRGTVFFDKIETYNEEDYKTISGLGMNMVNIQLSYRNIETASRQDSLWKSLNTHINLAKKYDIRIILTLLEAPGGYQWDLNTYNKLWQNEALQIELLNFWKLISSNYNKEPIIAGYDILHYPHPSESISQWEILANKIIRSIRENDKKHLIIIQNAKAVQYSWKARKEYLTIEDENIMYSFHYIFPDEYTEQSTAWNQGDGGIYPDPGKLQIANCVSPISNTNYDPRFTSERWSYYAGSLFKISDPRIKVGNPCLNSFNNPGKTFFYGFVIKEFGPTGVFIRNVMEVDFSDNNEWYLWSNVSGSSGTCERGMEEEEIVEGYKKNMITIFGTNSIAGATNARYRFPVKQGYSYSISGWGKIENATPNSNSFFSIAFEGTEEDNVVLPRTREYLKRELQRLTEFGEKNHYPMYVSHYWVSDACYLENRGGEEWLNDVLSLFDEYKLHSSFSSYRGNKDGFTLAKGDNKKLINKKIGEILKIKLYPNRKRKVIFKVNNEGKQNGISFKVKLTNRANSNDTLSVFSDREGLFSVSLREGDIYNIEINSTKGYTYYNEKINVSSLGSAGAGDTSITNITLKHLNKETVFLLKNIHFEFNSYEYSQSSFSELQQLFILMNNNPGLKILIEAHTDDIGSDKFNLWLSEQRAICIRNYLVKSGIVEKKINIKAFGKTKPLYPNSNQTNRARNRRVEVRIVEIAD